jgi:putative oxidoreductase
MNYQKLAAFGPLPIRILAGIAFIVYGLPKFSNVAGTEMFLENWDCRRTWQS